MRLTKYEPSDESMFHYKLKDEELSTELDSIHKLGQLEDIEEELGIDLITWFNCLFSEEFYLKQGKDIVICDYEISLNKALKGKSGWYFTSCFGKKYYLKDYGKTWALTKEELV